MNITSETMILFGGTILVFLLRLKRSRVKKRRYYGSAMLVALLVEFLTFIVGVSIFLLGAYRLVP